MVRQALRYQVLDSSGVPIAGASIQVAQVGTTTNITQTMYAGLTGVTAIANPLITDASGRVQAYLDGEDAVALLRVTMIPTLTGFTFTSRDVQLGSDYGVLDAGDVPIKGLTVDAKDRFNMARTDAGDPTSLVVGDMWYNTATNALHWEDNTGTQTVSSTTGDITGVTAGDGLSGGGLTGDVTLNVVAGNAINVDATDVEVDVNAATSAAAALDGTDKILISDTDDANTTKSATISQIDPTMLDGTANQVYFSNSTGNVTGLTLGASGTVLTSAGATSDPTFSAAASVGNNKALFTNNTGVESGATIGAAGTVLTSNGTDATANPPTWEAAGGGGGSVQMTSSGSITAGNLVVLSAADTVKEVTDTRVAPTLNTNTTYSQGFAGSSYSSGMVWNGNTTTPTVLATWISTINSNWYVQAGTYATNTVTWGTTVEVGAGTTWWYGGNNAIYDSTNNGWWTWAGTTGSGYYPYVNFNTVSGTSVTAGTPVANTQGYSAYYYIQGNLAHDTTNNRTLFAYMPSGSLYYQPFTVSGTTVTIGATAISQSGGTYKSPAVFWNASLARMVVMGCGSSYKISMAYRQYDSGSGTYTATNINGATHIESSARNISNPLYNNSGQGFDMGSNRYVYVTNNVQYYLIVTCLTADSASTGSIGTTSIFDGTTSVVSDGTGVGQTIQIANYGNWQASYDQTTESLIIFARDKDSATPMRIHTLKYNATTDLWAQAGATVELTGDGAGGTAQSFNGGATAQVIDSSGNERAIWGASGTTDAASALAENYLVYTGASGTTDAPDVIGVSADTVGTGVAVNVNVVGGVNENVTGLTSNAEYYIQGDGSLATSEATPNYGKLGRALATDKLLITGIGDPTVTNQ